MYEKITDLISNDSFSGISDLKDILKVFGKKETKKRLLNILENKIKELPEGVNKYTYKLKYTELINNI